jgi:hypothetical protein
MDVFSIHASQHVFLSDCLYKEHALHFDNKAGAALLWWETSLNLRALIEYTV